MGIDAKSLLAQEEQDLIDYLSDGEVEEDGPASLQVDKSFPSTLIVVNLPQVEEGKYTKLRSMLDKMFDKCGSNEKYMPLNEKLPSPATEGFMIVTYGTPAQADDALEKFDNFYLDKKHTVRVYKLDEFDDITAYNGSTAPQLDQQSADENPDDIRDWLTDEQAREMFVTRFDQGENEIYWHNHISNQAELEYGGEREKKGGKLWCDSKVQWSPWGGYLATFHRPGIALWGGYKFTKRARFAHDDVKHIEFSPNEEYLLTWNGRHATEKDPNSVKIWRILTNECVVSWPTPSVTPRGGEFPHFLWSPDGRFIARCSENTIYVYDAEDNFALCMDPATDKRVGIKFPEGLHCFDWSPKENILSVWIPEKDNVPARLQLIRMPMRQELAAKNLFNVRDASMHWQPSGRYLCVNAVRLSKSKKTGHTHLEIFRVAEKNVPVETVEIKDQMVKSFHWESNGNRFAVLTTDENGHGLKARFYAITEKETSHVAVYDLSFAVSTILWAPGGQYFVMAAIPGGDLIFGQLDPNNKLDILAKDDHFLLTEVHWDASSRYVISAVTQSMQGGRYQTEAGYKVWQFQGKLMYAQTREKLFQIAWRPHPPSLLSEQKKNEIRANLKAYSKKYEQKDEVMRDASKIVQHKHRLQKIEEFEKVLARVAEFKKAKVKQHGWAENISKLADIMKWEDVTEVREEVLEVKEEAA